MNDHMYNDAYVKMNDRYHGKYLKIEISQVYFQFLDNLRKQNDNLIQQKKERKSLIKTNSMIRKQNN